MHVEFGCVVLAIDRVVENMANPPTRPRRPARNPVGVVFGLTCGHRIGRGIDRQQHQQQQ
jgi:hypothetical protein